MESLLFTPAKIGPIEIKNRVIRASAYEGMCDGHVPTQQLKDYHTAVARGGVGMTSVAYASINKSGLSFHRQLWMRPEISRCQGLHPARSLRQHVAPDVLRPETSGSIERLQSLLPYLRTRSA